MQLLTASKLSTVAMLAMAAVLHFSVSAVPMEQPDVQAAPAVEPRPDFAAYRSTVRGQPSEKAIEDMAAILNTLLPPDEEYGLSFFGEEPQPASPSSGDVNQEDISHMSLYRLKEAAHKSQRQFDLVKERLPHLTQELITQLNEGWNQLSNQVKSLQTTEEQQKEFIFASPSWEKIVRNVYGIDQLEECPYEQLPYSENAGDLDKSLQGPNISEEEWFAIVGRNGHAPKAYINRNVCRLWVNGAYPWLFRMLVMHGERSDYEIFSVLGQLRLFTPDKAFARDLDELLKLFAKINWADGRRVHILYRISRLLVLSTPEVIPFMILDLTVKTDALLFYLAAKQHKRGEDTHLVVGKTNLLETLAIGDINVIVDNLRLRNHFSPDLKDYVKKLTNHIFKLCGRSNVSILTATKNMLAHPPSGLKIDEAVGHLELASNDYTLLNPIEVLVNIIDLDQFVNLYQSVPSEHKGLPLIIMAGRSHLSPDIMKFVFDDVLDVQGAPIKDGIQVDGHSLRAAHLARLVQGCAMVCTEKNWLVFVDLFVKKVKDTEQLSGHTSSPTKPAQRVANEISKLVEELEQKLNSIKFKRNSRRRPEFTKVTGEVKNLMRQVAEMLADEGLGRISTTKKAIQA